MGERKLLNKYFPPDFDPSKLPRNRKPNSIHSRFMLPMSIRCQICGNFIKKCTKSNADQEKVVGKTYLGIRKFRFYIKCTNCKAEITIKTDPQNSDYEVEHNATRNFEPWRFVDEEEAAEIEEDAMKSLENRSRVSKIEMDNIAALDELKSLKSRQSNWSVEATLEALRNQDLEERRKLEEEEEARVIKAVFQREKAVCRRISDDVFNDDGNLRPVSGGNGGLKRKKVSEVRIFAIKKKKEEKSGNDTNSVLKSLCQNYDSEDEEDESNQ